MLDWIGTLRVRARTPRRVELCLTRSTTVAGWVLGAGAAALGVLIGRGQWPAIAWALPVAITVVAALLATVRRTLVFDRDDGVLHVEQRLFGITSRAVVPMFHLRAVVIAARLGARVGPRFIAYVDRRIGNPIHLDESQRCATLLPIAEAIAEVAELRLVYDATTKAAIR